ncbi:MAG: hypothetical protein FJZ01_20845 [Candidatus Sericytochromatia bacterium]|nr:hypothetical protein [Candidatus Tanganyikabacteria bacterium]
MPNKKTESPRDSFLKEIQAGFFGDYLISKGLVTQANVNEALEKQGSAMRHLRIGEILCELGYLDPEKLLPSLKEYRAELRLGEVLISTQQLSFLQLLDALDEQRRTGQSFGQVVVRLGYCSQDRVDEALELQKTLHAE